MKRSSACLISNRSPGRQGSPPPFHVLVILPTVTLVSPFIHTDKLSSLSSVDFMNSPMPSRVSLTNTSPLFDIWTQSFLVFLAHLSSHQAQLCGALGVSSVSVGQLLVTDVNPVLTACSSGQAVFICSLSLPSVVSILRGCYLGKVFIMDGVSSSALWAGWVFRASATSGVPLSDFQDELRLENAHGEKRRGIV